MIIITIIEMDEAELPGKSKLKDNSIAYLSGPPRWANADPTFTRIGVNTHCERVARGILTTRVPCTINLMMHNCQLQVSSNNTSPRSKSHFCGKHTEGVVGGRANSPLETQSHLG